MDIAPQRAPTRRGVTWTLGNFVNYRIGGGDGRRAKCEMGGEHVYLFSQENTHTRSTRYTAIYISKKTSAPTVDRVSSVSSARAKQATDDCIGFRLCLLEQLLPAPQLVRHRRELALRLLGL